MYHLVGASEVVQSVSTFVAAQGADSGSKDLAGLRTSLFTGLHSIDRTPHSRPNHEVRVTNGVEADVAARFPLDRDNFDQADSGREKSVNEGWASFASDDPILRSLAMLMLNQIFTTSGTRSGSMSDSSAVGHIWVAPGHAWDMQDVHEAILHELTHQFLFVDELVHPHFDPGVNDVRVSSSIRGESRELAAAVHSAIVASEILRFRARVEDGSAQHALHGNTDAMRTGLQHTIEEIRSENQTWGLLKPRMQGLITSAGSVAA
jgi:hypothetical protein